MNARLDLPVNLGYIEAGGAAAASATRFALLPPSDGEHAWKQSRHILLVSFSAATIDLGLGQEALRRLRLKAGSAITALPDTPLRLRALEPAELLMLATEPAHLRAIGDRAAAGRAWHMRSFTDLADPGVAAVAHEIRRVLLADPLPEPTYLQALADAVLARLVCWFLGEVEHVRPGEALSPATLSRLVRHIDAHLGDAIDITALGEMAGLSRAHFSRAFQRMTGDPPLRFIMKRRLCRARDLISAGAQSLSEVAASTGFASQAHLTTVFRKELGVTPGGYRAAFRKAGADGGFAEGRA